MSKISKTKETEIRVAIARGCQKDRGLVGDCLMVIGFLLEGDRNVLELVVMVAQPCQIC